VTGLFAENAAVLFDERIPLPELDQHLKAVRKGISLLHSLGIGCVFSHEIVESMPVLRALDRENQKLRIFFSLPARKFEESLEAFRNPDNSMATIRPAWMKVFVDGSLGSKSAEMFEGYTDRSNETGIPTTGDAELDQIVGRSNGEGIPVAIHSIGDKANHRAMQALKNHGVAGNIRNRIEHVQVLSERDLGLAGELDAVLSMQPVHLLADAGIADRAWGERCRYAFAHRTLLDGGALLNFGSDAPVETPDPLQGIWAAVTRHAYGFED